MLEEKFEQSAEIQELGRKLKHLKEIEKERDIAVKEKNERYRKHKEVSDLCKTYEKEMYLAI